MDTAQTAHWLECPIRIGSDDIRIVELTPEEKQAITEYGDSMFTKEQIDKRPSQFPLTHGKNKLNPNTKGMFGEYAGLKHFQGSSDVKGFLADRPYRTKDMGDAIMIFDDKVAKILDYKTKFKPFTVEELLSEDNIMAEMDAKFLNPKTAGYLDIFVFCTQSKSEDILLVGWEYAKEYFKYAEFVPKYKKCYGHPIPYFNDSVMMPYRRLRPISELAELEYHVVDSNLTPKLTREWNEGTLDVSTYIPHLRQA